MKLNKYSMSYGLLYYLSKLNSLIKNDFYKFNRIHNFENKQPMTTTMKALNHFEISITTTISIFCKNPNQIFKKPLSGLTSKVKA